MAGEKFLRQIKEAARFLATKQARDARGYLAEPLETAFRIIDCVEQSRKTAEEIALATGLNLNTVKCVIRSLKAGGYPITSNFAEEIKTGERKPVPR
jgi:transcription initiation factor IIE alpha subunit